jgi:hypothetical protein
MFSRIAPEWGLPEDEAGNATNRGGGVTSSTGGFSWRELSPEGGLDVSDGKSPSWTIPGRFRFWPEFGISFAFAVALSLEIRFQWMKDFGVRPSPPRVYGHS